MKKKTDYNNRHTDIELQIDFQVMKSFWMQISTKKRKRRQMTNIGECNADKLLVV